MCSDDTSGRQPDLGSGTLAAGGREGEKTEKEIMERKVDREIAGGFCWSKRGSSDWLEVR